MTEAGSSARSNVADTAVSVPTPVAASAGVVAVTVGAVGAVIAVEKLHVTAVVSGVPSAAVTAVVIVAV